MWVVYEHISPSGKVYVGITNDIKKRWCGNGSRYCTYNSIFKKAIEKYGWNNLEHKIILANLTKSEANYTEKYLIKWYKLHNISYNITDGDEGTLGRKVSEETRIKMRSKALGRKISEEQRLKLSIAHKSETAINSSKETIKFAWEAWRGKHHTDETKQKMSQKAKGRNMSKAVELSALKRSKPVIQLKNGIVINIFSSVREAGRILNISTGNIGNCANGLRKTAGGFNWKFKEEE